MRRWGDLRGDSVLTLKAMAPVFPPKTLLKKKGKTSGVSGSVWILLHHWPSQV